MLRNARGARDTLGLSERDLGVALAQRVPGRLKPYSKSTINGWERRRNPMTEDVRKAYGILLATWLAERLQRYVGVTLDVQTNGSWHMRVWMQCGLCRRWFQLRRLKWKRCEKCRRRGRPRGIDVSF